jgi:transposase
MDAAEQLKRDVREGRIDLDRLVELLISSQRQLQRAQQQLEQAKKRIEELEKKLGGSPTVKTVEAYSMRAEEQRQQAHGKKPRKKSKPRRRGRLTTAQKVAQAERTEKVFPLGVPESDCKLSHTRPVWRFENGRTVLIAYEVYRGPKNQYGEIPGALGRSEFGMEIIVAVAHLVHVVGLSFDKACAVLNFFQNLRLRKSQVEALLNQLSRHWESEFETLCALLANSLVVHADETGWSVNSAWAFLSEKARLVLFGVHKDSATLHMVLDPATFTGILVSDDAAVYAGFTNMQKCWAHLLRKAIKLTLLEPENAEYRRLADGLLEIYRKACRVQQDTRLSDDGRRRKVAQLDDEIVDLCGPAWFAELPPSEGPADDYRLLINELMRLMIDRQLFTFVTAAPVATPLGKTVSVSGTNNEAERTLRSPAQARDTGRTNKTPKGARRRTVIVSVLESLRQYLATYTLSSVIAEVCRWSATGRSCFRKLARKLRLSPPAGSVLDLIHPQPSG